MNQSLSFRVFKAILALPVPVAIIIPSLLLYFSGWQLSDFVLWRFLIGAVCFLAGLLLAVSTVRLFPNVLARNMKSIARMYPDTFPVLHLGNLEL